MYIARGRSHFADHNRRLAGGSHTSFWRATFAALLHPSRFEVTLATCTVCCCAEQAVGALSWQWLLALHGLMAVSYHSVDIIASRVSIGGQSRPLMLTLLAAEVDWLGVFTDGVDTRCRLGTRPQCSLSLCG